MHHICPNRQTNDEHAEANKIQSERHNVVPFFHNSFGQAHHPD